MAAALKCQAARTTRRRLHRGSQGTRDLGGGPSPGDPGSTNLWPSSLTDTDKARPGVPLRVERQEAAHMVLAPNEDPAPMVDSSPCDNSASLPP